MEGLGVMGTRGKHVNVLQHLIGFLTNHLSSEDKACLGQVGAAGPHRGLPAGTCAPDRAADAAEASPEPLPGAGLGAPAGVPASLPEGADAAESRVGQIPFAHSPRWWYTFSSDEHCKGLVSTDRWVELNGDDGSGSHQAD